MSSCHALTGTWLVMSVEARSAAILEDFEQILPLDARERGQAPIVDDEQIGLGQASEQARVGAIAAGDVQLVEEPRGARTQ